MVVGAINMDIRGMADIRYPKAASHRVLFTVPQAASDVISRITALLVRDVHLISAIGNDFYGETLLKKQRRAA